MLGRVAHLPLDPVGETRMQLGARALQEPAIGRVADQHVVEAQGRLAEEPAGVGLDELAAAERFEPRIEIADLAGQKVRDGRARELPPDHRGPLEHGALLRTEPLDTGRQQGLDGGRHLEGGDLDPGDPPVALPLERAVVHEHAHQLADEERVALARGQHPSGDRRRQLVGADHVRGQPRGRAGVETGERHDFVHEAAGCGQRRARVAQLGARRDEHEQRHLGAPLHEVLGQVEQQRLRPLQVVDREHHRLRRRERGEQAADDEEGLLRRRRRPGEERGDASRDARTLGCLAGYHRLDRRAQGIAAGAGVDVEQRTQRLGEGRERGAPGRVAPRGDHGGPLADPARELGDQPRLAEARRAEDHGQSRPARRDGGVVDRHDAAQLVLAPDERGRRRARRPIERHHAVRRHALGPPLQREDTDGREGHQLAH